MAGAGAKNPKIARKTKIILFSTNDIAGLMVMSFCNTIFNKCNIRQRSLNMRFYSNGVGNILQTIKISSKLL